MSLLDGRVVATTRAGDADDPLVRELERAGATVLVWPTMTFQPPDDPKPLRDAAGRLGTYDWVAFTSPRGVDALLDLAPMAPDGVKVAAVGPGTARALEKGGWPVDVTGNGGAGTLVSGWGAAHDLRGARVLFPAAHLAHATLEAGLAERGAVVERVEAYRTRPKPPDPGGVRADLERGVDVVTFASPSAVRSFAACLEGYGLRILEGCGVAAIGPTTREALVEIGLEGDRIVTAAPPSWGGLVEAAAEASRRAVRPTLKRPS